MYRDRLCGIGGRNVDPSYDHLFAGRFLYRDAELPLPHDHHAREAQRDHSQHQGAVPERGRDRGFAEDRRADPRTLQRLQGAEKRKKRKKKAMRLFLSDVDGTLLSFSRTVKQEDMDAIRAWQMAGHAFGLVTGRDMNFCLRFLKEYGIVPDCLISSNGASVYHEGRLFPVAHMEPQLCRQVFEKLAGLQEYMVPFITTDEGVHYFAKKDVDLMKKEQAHLKYFSSQDVYDLLAHINRVPKLSVYVRNADWTDQLYEKVREWFPDLNCAKTSIDYIELTKKGCDKAQAMAFLEKELSLDLKQCAFIGDGENDIPMMDRLEHTYVMESADENVRSHAKYTVSGVKEALEHEGEK
ncbi:MAG TPA: hypothetical protein DCP49_02650 [Erysipelotrichaceae bacterium]|nr:hypothetical protein [Erysipelotrichaceae bacterium]